MENIWLICPLIQNKEIVLTQYLKSILQNQQITDTNISIPLNSPYDEQNVSFCEIIGKNTSGSSSISIPCWQGKKSKEESVIRYSLTSPVPKWAEMPLRDEEAIDQRTA